MLTTGENSPHHMRLIWLDKNHMFMMINDDQKNL